MVSEIISFIPVAILSFGTISPSTIVGNLAVKYASRATTWKTLLLVLNVPTNLM